MGVNNNYRTPPKQIGVDEKTIRDIAEVLNNAMKGKTNNTGEVTLTPSTTSTTVKNILCNANSVVILQPVTANAAGLATPWPEADSGEFIIHHASNASVDLTFRYVIVG